MESVKLAVIYYSATGTVHKLAQAAAAAGEAAGAAVRLRRVAEIAPDEAIAQNEKWLAHTQETAQMERVSLDDVEWADAVLWGTPTRFGLPAAQLKQFMDTTGGLWAAGTLVNKVMSSFTSSTTPHGGQESTILALNNTFYHWGAIIVGPGYADPIQFKSGNPYGTSHTSQGAEVPPGEIELAAMTFQTKRLVELAGAFKRGLA